jgi:RNA polymerase sigma-70 factor, ECF subfamily
MELEHANKGEEVAELLNHRASNLGEQGRHGKNGATCSGTIRHTFRMNRAWYIAVTHETTQTVIKDETRHLVCESPYETQLLLRAKDGCSNSFDLLCAPHRTRLLKTAFKITRNKEDAEDAVQDSFLRAFMRINEFRGASSFSTWLTRIVINSALMIRRQTRRARSVPLDSAFEDTSKLNREIGDAAPDPEWTLMTQERKRALRKAIYNLRPQIRAVLKLGPLRESSMEETARILNISLPAAKARLFRGCAALRKSTALRAFIRSRGETMPDSSRHSIRGRD